MTAGCRTRLTALLVTGTGDKESLPNPKDDLHATIKEDSCPKLSNHATKLGVATDRFDRP